MIIILLKILKFTDDLHWLQINFYEYSFIPMKFAVMHTCVWHQAMLNYVNAPVIN